MLLTPTAAYPRDAYLVTLDRSTITPEIRKKAAQGRVVLRILVRSDGSAASVEISESSGHAVLDVAALRAAWEWRFEPATRDGEPIEAWVLLPVRFVIP